MDKRLERINRSLIIGWLTIVTILIGSYSIEVIKGERTTQYFAIFALTMLIPLLVIYITYLRKKDTKYLCYMIVAGYSVMYAFVMFTGSTQMVFSYILPMLSFLILYHNPMLIMITGAITIMINAFSFAYQISNNVITPGNVKEVEIRFAVIIVTFVGSYFSARLFDQLFEENNVHVGELFEKNEAISQMAIQTIATIANTIDAKDEYTRGHSVRVAKYSSAIAEEIGMTEAEVKEINSIALLHDIGKIGVPDSVLNKPGKLTDDEYELMKQHTTIGAEILKDIGMFQGIDIGAKYHHERYDGKGYPDGLCGEEIPKIARIIAVADAFDAMTSNRVYRKQLDINHVMDEIERCKGTQFDPQMADAMIKMLKEKRIEPIKSNENQDMSDVSKIWARVIEKGEEKFKDKSMYDELTGLYSRNYGEKLIKDAIENDRGTIVVADVDHFRRINSEAGFLLGDIFLRTVASCLSKIEQKNIVSRYGGDEFVILFPDLIDKNIIQQILDEVMVQIKEHNSQIGADIDCTLSLGVKICEGIKNSYQDVFLDADRALYMSKQNGGDCYRFYEKKQASKDYNEKGNVDLLKLKNMVNNLDSNEKYILESPEFQNAYQLIKRLIEESEESIQLVLFTINPNDDVNVSLETQNQVADILEKTISRSIKGKDFSLRYSSTQRLVLLIDSGTNGAHAVSGHILRDFYKSYDKKDVNVSFSTIGLR